MVPSVTVCLGGHDLEMVAVAALLAERPDVRLLDRGLAWGATASAYAADIRAAVAAGRRVALVELADDLPADFPRDQLVWIDHHGPLAGRVAPTSLEQVFRLLDFPADRWTRDLELVAANDRGHLPALARLGASVDEMRDIRRRDRAAQGITAVEEASGRAAADRRETLHGGRLTVVRLPHGRSATVTDVLAAELGGPGYANLLVVCPGTAVFFGSGRCVEKLRAAVPGGWCGGELPERGFWGVAGAVDEHTILEAIREGIMSPEHSKKITVEKYHLHLIWPVLLRGRPPQFDRDNPIIHAWAEWFVANAGWSDPLKDYGPGDKPPVPDEYSYEETVYFHPFFRDFLMGDGGTGKKDLSVRLLTRDDVKQVRVDMDGLSRNTFDVGRVQLYLLKPCVAVLTVELVATGLSLWEVQRFQDRIRRIYPPFWDGDGNPGLCPKSVTWVGAGGDLRESNLTADQNTFRDFSRAGGEPPVCDHWRFFFGPLKPLRTRGPVDTPDICYQQVLDERIPLMAYLAVPDPSRIAVGDYDRLTFVDDPNDSVDDARTSPYNTAFLDRSRAEHTYDRFSHYGTTYLCSGYGFSVVGKADWFFQNIVLGHFRRHYFRMGLVAHYQRAALLYFADELSDAIKTLAGKGPGEELLDPAFRRRLEDIQMGFLKFRSRAFFPEVSNQLQGHELWRFWFHHLNTQALFDAVDTASERLTGVLGEYETRELTKAQAALATAQAKENEEMKRLTRSQEKLARSQEKLARFAAIFLPFSLALSALSVLFAGDFLPKLLAGTPAEVAGKLWWWVGMFLVAAVVTAWVSYSRLSKATADRIE